MATGRLRGTSGLPALPLFLLLPWLGAPAMSQPGLPAGCEPGLIAQSATLPHPYRPRAAYCDGAVGERHSAGIWLVSLTVGRVAFGTANRLLARPIGAGNLSLRLRGVDVRKSRRYRLDGMIGPAGLAIDLGAAAIPEGVTEATLGLRAWSGPNQREIYYPVFAGGNPADDLVATFRIDEEPLEVRASVCDDQGCRPARVEGNYHGEGAVIRIAVARSATPRQVQVNVRAMFVNNRPGGNIFHLLVPGR